MSGDINRVPWGLLSLLDTQTQGVVPSILGDQVSGTIDLTALYFASKRPRQSIAMTSSSTVGYLTAATITVPEGYLWVVINASVAALHNEAGAAAPGVNIGAELSGGAGFRALLGPDYGRSVGAGGTIANAYTFTPPIMAVAGSTFVPYYPGATGAILTNIDFTIYLTYYELKV